MSPKERAVRLAWCAVIVASVSTWPVRWRVGLAVARFRWKYCGA